MRINDKGIALLKQFEGCKLTAYQDGGGVWTIGYGHTGDIATKGRTIDQLTADCILIEDIEKTEKGLLKLLKRPVNDNQFSALVCFAFNVGLSALKRSTLLTLLNNGTSPQIVSQEFLRWNKDNGKEVAGLTKRRKAEKDLFLSV
jgi:lysozyme